MDVVSPYRLRRVGRHRRARDHGPRRPHPQGFERRSWWTYQYRLGAIDNSTGEQSYSEIVTVTVPVATTFALEGAVPNPAGKNLRIAYTLGGVSSSRIALYNVAGRILKSVDLTGRGVGRHTIDLGDGMSLASGRYFVKLVQGDRVLVKPVVVAE